MIVGLADLDQQASGRLGRRAILYYFGTTMLAVILGIILVYIINPGSKASNNVEPKKQKEVRAMDSLLDIIRYGQILLRSDFHPMCFARRRRNFRPRKIFRYRFVPVRFLQLTPVWVNDHQRQQFH